MSAEYFPSIAGICILAQGAFPPFCERAECIDEAISRRASGKYNNATIHVVIAAVPRAG